MKTLSKRQILMLHQQLVEQTGGSDGIRDDGLCFGLVKNHPFVDGNKRIGAHAMLVFLAVNGVELTYTQTELSDIILQVAASEKEYPDLLDWLIRHQN